MLPANAAAAKDRSASVGSGDNSLEGQGGVDDRAGEGAANGPQREIDAYVAWLGQKSASEARRLTDPERTFLAFATETGRVLPPSTIKDLQASSEDLGGEEHFVYRRDGRIWKVLQPGKGYSLGGDPLEYLMRIGRLQAAVPQLDIRVEGALPKGKAPRIVASMAEIQGTQPTVEALNTWLQDHGLDEVGKFAWEHTSGVEMADAAADNFIEVDGDMVPIDVWFSGDVTAPMFFDSGQTAQPASNTTAAWPSTVARANDISIQEFADLARKGSLRKAMGSPSINSDGTGKTPLSIGHRSGYPLEDIARFYVERRTKDAASELAKQSDPAGNPVIQTAFDQFMADADTEQGKAGILPAASARTVVKVDAAALESILKGSDEYSESDQNAFRAFQRAARNGANSESFGGIATAAAERSHLDAGGRIARSLAAPWLRRTIEFLPQGPLSPGAIFRTSQPGYIFFNAQDGETAPRPLGP